MPLQQQAYAYIQKLIAEGSIETGKIYSEKKIAADMGISRTPVRDAILRLSQDRYIDIVPSKGFRRHVLTEKDVNDTFEVRTAIEGFCAIRLHQQRQTPEGKEVLLLLRQDLENMDTALAEKQAEGVILGYDFRFHRRIVEFSGNADFLKLFDSYHHMLTDIAVKSYEEQSRPADSVKEHQEIYEGLISDGINDGELYNIVLKHMEAARDIALKLMREEA